MTGGFVRTVHRASSGDTQPSITARPKPSVVFVRNSRKAAEATAR